MPLDCSTEIFYSKLYKCDDCKESKEPCGVYQFVNGCGNPNSKSYCYPTIPVSHFGDIINSRIWVITTNPKGDRTDPLVNLSVDKFGVIQRSQLKSQHINRIFDIQSNYFREDHKRWHPFFLPFVRLLEGLQIEGTNTSFRKGDVCFVDAIKCPTATAWATFARTTDGKIVSENCLYLKNKYLENQIRLHKPKIVLYYGTGQLIKVADKGNKMREYECYSNGITVQVRTLQEPKRVSIEFSKADLKVTDSEWRTIRKMLVEETSRKSRSEK